MDSILTFLGNTLFGVGLNLMLVLGGIAWYLRSLRKRVERISPPHTSP
ncbi:MAG: hypothetical protein WD295_00615 [Bacteroidota bacterium]